MLEPVELVHGLAGGLIVFFDQVEEVAIHGGAGVEQIHRHGFAFLDGGVVAGLVDHEVLGWIAHRVIGVGQDLAVQFILIVSGEHLQAAGGAVAWVEDGLVVADELRQVA